MSLRRLLSLSVATCSAVAFGVAGAPSADASVPTTFCADKSYTYIVSNYTRGAETLTLRCGNASFGFNHITARWSAAFEANIALTISRGEGTNDLQQDGGDNIYALFDDTCNEIFRVVYNHGAYNGNDVMPQGIITAYAPGVVTAVSPSATVTPSYRTDCPIIQTI